METSHRNSLAVQLSEMFEIQTVLFLSMSIVFVAASPGKTMLPPSVAPNSPAATASSDMNRSPNNTLRVASSATPPAVAATTPTNTKSEKVLRQWPGQSIANSSIAFFYCIPFIHSFIYFILSNFFIHTAEGEEGKGCIADETSDKYKQKIQITTADNVLDGQSSFRGRQLRCVPRRRSRSVSQCAIDWTASIVFYLSHDAPCHSFHPPPPPPATLRRTIDLSFYVCLVSVFFFIVLSPSCLLYFF